MDCLYRYFLKKEEWISRLIIYCYCILYLPSWSDSPEKSNTSLLVTNPDLRTRLSKSSQTFHVNLGQAWADCNLIYLFVAWFSLEFLEFFKLNPFTKGLGRECLSLKLSFSFPLVFQWQRASNENEVLGTKAQTSSLKLPLKTPAEGLGLLFFLMDESAGTCFERHYFVCKVI